MCKMPGPDTPPLPLQNKCPVENQRAVNRVQRRGRQRHQRERNDQPGPVRARCVHRLRKVPRALRAISKAATIANQPSNEPPPPPPPELGAAEGDGEGEPDGTTAAVTVTVAGSLVVCPAGFITS